MQVFTVKAPPPGTRICTVRKEVTMLRAHQPPHVLVAETIASLELEMREIARLAAGTKEGRLAAERIATICASNNGRP